MDPAYERQRGGLRNARNVSRLGPSIRRAVPLVRGRAVTGTSAPRSARGGPSSSCCASGCRIAQARGIRDGRVAGHRLPLGVHGGREEGHRRGPGRADRGRARQSCRRSGWPSCSWSSSRDAGSGLPAGGADSLASYVLPGLTLGWFVVAGMMRLLRSGMLEVLDSEYVKLARLKGVAERKSCGPRLKNALIPVRHLRRHLLRDPRHHGHRRRDGARVAGAGAPRLRRHHSRDFPVIQAVVLTTAAIVAAVNLGVDCLYALIDRASGTGNERHRSS